MEQPESVDPLERAIDVFNQLSEGLSDKDGNVSGVSASDLIAYVQAAAQIAIAQRLDLLRQAIIQSAVAKGSGSAKSGPGKGPEAA